MSTGSLYLYILLSHMLVSCGFFIVGSKMNKLILSNTPLTMSSLEIAKLTSKEHRNVLADVRNMFDELQINCAEFSAEYKDSTGRTLPCFHLPRRETLILVTGYNVQMRAKIIDRWDELEQRQKLTAPQASPALELFTLHSMIRDDLVKTLHVNPGIAQSKMYESVAKQFSIDMSGYAALIPARTESVAPKYNPTALGKLVGLTAAKVNLKLAELGLQARVNGSWVLTEPGLKHAEQTPYTRHGHSGYQIMWSESVLTHLAQ